MARATDEHTPKPSRRRTSRQSGRGSRSNPAKADSKWMPLGDIRERWHNRFGSSKLAVQELDAFLRSGVPSLKRHISAGGEVSCSVEYADFWENEAWLSVETDINGVDYLGVHYNNVSWAYDPDERVEFCARTSDVEDWERLYPTIAASLPVPGKERKPAPKKKRRKAKQASGAGAPEQHDWEEGELFVMRELKTRGNPLDKKYQSKGWKTISDVAKLARGHLQKYSEDSVGPDMSTTRGKVSGWIKKFERERN